MKSHMRLIALLCLFLFSIEAQTAFRIPYACTEQDLDAFGLDCSPQEPCPVYAELVAVESLSGRRILNDRMNRSMADRKWWR